MPGQRSDKRTTTRRSLEGQRAYYEWRLQELEREKEVWHERSVSLWTLLIDWGSKRLEGED